jgi:hypothetical protein
LPTPSNLRFKSAFRPTSAYEHLDSQLRNITAKRLSTNYVSFSKLSTSMGGFHAVSDISCCCSNADDSISDTSSTGDALSDSFLRPPWKIGHWIRRVWHQALLARRADRSPSDLAIRLLPGQRSGSVHSQSNDARSSIWPMALTAILSSGALRLLKSLQQLAISRAARAVIAAPSVGTEKARSRLRTRSVDRYDELEPPTEYRKRRARHGHLHSHDISPRELTGIANVPSDRRT